MGSVRERKEFFKSLTAEKYQMADHVKTRDELIEAFTPGFFYDSMYFIYDGDLSKIIEDYKDREIEEG